MGQQPSAGPVVAVPGSAVGRAAGPRAGSSRKDISVPPVGGEQGSEAVPQDPGRSYLSVSLGSANDTPQEPCPIEATPQPHLSSCDRRELPPRGR